MLKVLELFAGIGACSKALTNLGIEHEIVDAVEIDKYAIMAFNAIHGTNFEPQDITEWDKDIKADLIMHGSPCQDFSIAGKGAGGDKDSGTRSSLMYETLRIVEKLEPKYVIWENVKNLLSKKHRHNFDAYLAAMEKLGYTNYYQVLNAKDYGVPQNRERVFTVSIRKDVNNGFKFPARRPLTKHLKDVLEADVDEKYYLSDEQIASFVKTTEKAKAKGNGFRFEPTNGAGYAKCISTRAGSRQTDNFISIIDDTYGYEQSPREYTEISPTLRSGRQGLKIKTANKTGYDIAADGDGVDLAYPNSNTRRGRVGHGVNKTVVCADTLGVLLDASIQHVGDLDIKGNDQIKRVYDTGGVSPTLSTMAGGNRQPKIVIAASRGRGSNNEQHLEPRRDGMTNTLTSVQKDNYVVRDYRIRKLTPKECYRLMGFDDASFDRASKVISNTQLYKTAGNSIVVNVLEAILKELLNGSTN